jgi:hypothetical protein
MTTSEILRKALLVSIIILCVSLVSSLIYVYVNYNTYFDTYMTSKQKKITLADDYHVDSLLNVIYIQDSLIMNNASTNAIIIDSITKNYLLIIMKKDSIIQDQKKNLSLKDGVISHQNQMIEKLMK